VRAVKLTPAQAQTLRRIGRNRRAWDEDSDGAIVGVFGRRLDVVNRLADADLVTVQYRGRSYHFPYVAWLTPRGRELCEADRPKTTNEG
jgi:hypothetical protein